MDNEVKLSKTQRNFIKSGIRFECQGSGKCCASRGEYGFVYLTLHDRKRLARFLNLQTRKFTQKYCQKTDGVFHLREVKRQPDCLFLQDKKCAVYEARPTQCRTWPFWPELMNVRKWNEEVVNFCPGVNKGRIWKKEEIEKQLNLQIKADECTD